MAFVTEAQVKGMFRNIDVAGDTSITSTDTIQFIDDADSEINAILKEFYVIPITGSEALKILQTISKYKVAHIIKTILELNVQVSDKVQEVQTNLERKADRMMKNIIPQYDSKTESYLRPLMPLPDAVLLARVPKDASIITSPTLEPTFEKGRDNW